jgi:predicted transglutaminase-like cysteine proteinase
MIGWRFSEQLAKEQFTEAMRMWRDGVHCTANAACNRWLRFLEEIRSEPPREQLDAVNGYVNRLKYQAEEDDIWDDPVAFFSTGHGDCEEFAIAKYVSLKILGWDEDDLRLLLTHTRRGEGHAFLGVLHKGYWYALDNLDAQVRINWYTVEFGLVPKGGWYPSRP